MEKRVLGLGMEWVEELSPWFVYVTVVEGHLAVPCWHGVR